VTTVSIFSSVNKIVLTLLDEDFSATVSNDWVLQGSSLNSAVEHGHFSAQTFYMVEQRRL